MFFKFCKHFNALNTTIPWMDIFSLEVDELTAQAIKQWKSHSMVVLQEDLIPARDDYNKLIQLCGTFSGDEVYFCWKTKALHKACWMTTR